MSRRTAPECATGGLQVPNLRLLSLAALSSDVAAGADDTDSSRSSSPILKMFPDEADEAEDQEGEAGPSTAPLGPKTLARTPAGPSGSADAGDSADAGPARDGFRPTRRAVLGELDRVVRGFLDPVAILEGEEDDEWMLEGSNSSGYAKVLLGMIEDIRLLAVKSTLVADSMAPRDDGVRVKLKGIVKKMVAIAEHHSKLKRPGGGRNINAMSKVQEEIARLRQLVRAYRTLPDDKREVVEIMEVQLRELSAEVEEYAEEKAERDVPDWVMIIRKKPNPSPEDRIRKMSWEAGRHVRKREAVEEALRTFSSLTALRAELERAKRLVQPPQGAAQQAKRAKVQSAFAIASDDEELGFSLEIAAVQPAKPEKDAAAVGECAAAQVALAAEAPLDAPVLDDVADADFVPEEIVYEDDFEADSEGSSDTR